MYMAGDTYGWRAKIGFICPSAVWCGCREYYPILPEGVAFVVATIGASKLAPEGFERYLPAAREFETEECDVIIAGGAATFTSMGEEHTQELMQKIRESVKVPVIMSLDAHFDALRALSAKKIVIATPHTEKRNEERRKLCEKAGFQVLRIKGLGVERRIDIERLPHYASYRLARQALTEAPEADAVYIPGPVMQTVRHIQQLEDDTGKPVVADVPAVIWAALRAIHLKAPVKGFGRLLESL